MPKLEIRGFDIFFKIPKQATKVRDQISDITMLVYKLVLLLLVNHVPGDSNFGTMFQLGLHTQDINEFQTILKNADSPPLISDMYIIENILMAFKTRPPKQTYNCLKYLPSRIMCELFDPNFLCPKFLDQNILYTKFLEPSFF